MNGMNEMVRVQIRGVETLNLVVAWLIRRSAKFAVEPLPDDDWIVSVKQETLSALIVFAEAYNI